MHVLKEAAGTLSLAPLLSLSVTHHRCLHVEVMLQGCFSRRWMCSSERCAVCRMGNMTLDSVAKKVHNSKPVPDESFAVAGPSFAPSAPVTEGKGDSKPAFHEPSEVRHGHNISSFSATRHQRDYSAALLRAPVYASL